MPEEPVTFRFCDERTNGISDKIDGINERLDTVIENQQSAMETLGESMTAMVDKHENRMNGNEVRLNTACGAILSMQQQMERDERTRRNEAELIVQRRDLSMRRLLVLFAGAAAFGGLLGNVDKLLKLIF